VVMLLFIFYVIDRYFYAKEEGFRPLQDPTPDSRIRVEGKLNFLFLGLILGAILLSALWKPQISIFGIELQNIVRDFIMLASALASLLLTSKDLHQENKFSFAPILEVAKLFAGIFTCMIPVIIMLQAGKAGAFAPLVAMVANANGSPNITAYFWISGILSSFLDNAPTYLIFFELAGGDAAVLMKQATILTAISAATVFMGANSYIGNAPNFMVYAIAKDAGVKMPSFFGYMAWSCAILIPLFLLLTYLFF
jgi:Na+/H+ antiporter NhaD/arsenite permease-like protein